MFSKMFSPRGAAFTRRILPFIFTFCFVMASALFSACSMGGDGGGILVGTWKNVASGGYTTVIEITADTITYTGSYEGKIVNSPNLTDPNGILIIQFTKHDTDYDGNPVSTHANVGKYGALYWKELTVSSVSMSDAFKKINPTDQWPVRTIFTTQAEAEAAFTIENEGVYINWSLTGPYTR